MMDEIARTKRSGNVALHGALAVLIVSVAILLLSGCPATELLSNVKEKVQAANVPSISAPSGLSIDTSVPSQLTVSWDPVVGATQYQIYRSETAESTGQSVKTTTNTSFVDKEQPSGDLISGTKYFYRVVAESDVATSPASAYVSITYDDSIPSVAIADDQDGQNDGTLYTKASTVTLQISASANAGVQSVEVKVDSANYQNATDQGGGVWSFVVSTSLEMTYSVTAKVTANDGKTNTESASIVVDRTAPSISTFTIETVSGHSNDPGYTTTTAVYLHTTVSGSPVKIKYTTNSSYGNNPSSWPDTSWATYNANVAFTLSTGDGQKTVWVQTEDNVGNKSAVLNDKIVLDQNGPTGNITVEDANSSSSSTTTRRNVKVVLNMQDAGTGLNQMRFQNYDGTWLPWTSYASSYSDASLEISVVYGTKTVNAQVTDNAGHTTNVSDTIYFSPDYNYITADDIKNSVSTGITYFLAGDDSNPGIQDSLTIGSIVVFRTNGDWNGGSAFDGYRYVKMQVLARWYGDSLSNTIEFKADVYDDAGNHVTGSTAFYIRADSTHSYYYDLDTLAERGYGTPTSDADLVYSISSGIRLVNTHNNSYGTCAARQYFLN